MNKTALIVVSALPFCLFSVWHYAGSSSSGPQKHEQAETTNAAIPLQPQISQVAEPHERALIGEASDSAQSRSTTTAPNTESELAQYPGFMHQPERDERIYHEEESARQRLIAQCMQRQGFAYTPQLPIIIEQHNLDQQRTIDTLLAEDPNERYLRGLDDDGRANFYLALYGTAQPNQVESSVFDVTVEGESCYGEAFQAIPGVYAKLNTLRQEYEAMQQSIWQDQRVTAVSEQWSTCMADEGHAGLTKPAHIDFVVEAAMEKLYNPGDNNYNFDHLSRETDLSSAVIALLNRMEAEVGEAARLDVLDDFVAEVEDLSTTCKHRANLDEVISQVTIEKENQFVQQHKARLES